MCGNLKINNVGEEEWLYKDTIGGTAVDFMFVNPEYGEKTVKFTAYSENFDEF
jgi:SHS2 domain-containing protein